MRSGFGQTRLGRSLLAALVGLLAVPRAVDALERPTPEQISQYRADGSLEERIGRAFRLGNHRVSPELVANASYRLRMDQWRKGLLDVQPVVPPAWKGMPTKGTVRIFALLISFSDYGPSNSQASIRDKLLGDGAMADFPRESLRNYYRRSSYDQLDLEGATLGWYAAGYPRRDVPQTAAGRDGLIKEALDAYDAAGHDFSRYDNDGDGVIDYFIVIWTGPDDGWASFWWAYQDSFEDSSYLLDGKRLGKYSWQWEASPAGGTFTPAMVIHETGHALGLPDYYDYNHSIGPRGGVGGLDMMDSTLGDHNCFSKFLLDWITPTVISGGKNLVSLGPSDSHGDAVLFANGATSDPFAEYFMVQNRTRTANDEDLPADGMLIWHVNARLDGTGDFFYDNSYTTLKLLRLMEADGLEQIEAGLAGDAGDYYVSGRTLTAATRPSSSRYGGSPTGMQVAGISAPGDPMTAHVDGFSDATAPIGAPGTPTDEGSTTSRGDVVFTWTPGTASDPESGISGYHLHVGTTPGGTERYDGAIGDVLTWTLENAQEGRTYYGRVRAVNGAGLASAWSGSSDGITVIFQPFPCAALDNCALAFTTGGNSAWRESATAVYYGATAARSGAIGHNQRSLLETVVAGPGLLSFWWTVSSQANLDVLSVYVDGVSASWPISGAAGWSQRQVLVGAGQHQVRWVYEKDSSLSSASDAAWVDRVEWTPGTELGRISGRVTDAASGAPLSGVTVRFYNEAGSEVDAHFVDSGGNYTSALVAPGNYHVLTTESAGHVDELFDNVPCPGHSCSLSDGTPVVVAPGATTAGINFALAAGGRISGTVTDASSETPLGAVSVYIYRPDGLRIGWGDTNGSGTYTTSGLPTGTYYARTSNSLGYVDELFDNVPCAGSCTVTAGTPIVVTQGATTTGISFALAAGGRISGTVTDASSGAPLPSVAVYVFDSSGTSVEGRNTNASGTYTASGLPAGAYYARTSNSLGYLDELFDNLACAGSCTVTAGTPIVVTQGATTTGVNFALAAGGRISGTVTDASSGAPLPSVAVYVFDSSGTSVEGRNTNTSGVYETSGLPAGTYYARTSNSLGYLDELFDNLPCPGSCTVTAGTPIVVTQGATTTGVNFALAAGGRISGTVTDASSGASLPSVAVYVFDSSGTSVEGRYTNTSGVYETSGLPAGTYYAMTAYSSLYVDELFDGIPCPSWNCTVTAGTPIVVTQGATTTGVNFALAAGGRISGTVTDASSGAHLSAVSVNIYRPDGVHIGRGDTNPSGTYTTSGLPAGTYYALTSSSLGYVDELFDNLPCPGSCTVTAGTPIVVTQGTTTSGVNFALVAGGRISGTVTDVSSGAPLPSVAVYVFDSSGTSVEGRYTNTSGVYETSGLPAGTYYAMTGYSSPYVDELFDGIPCPSWNCTVTAGTPIAVTQGATTSGIDFALDRPLSFFTVAPCRVVDTRDATRGGPLPLAAGSDNALALTGGACGIPPGAKAVSINITVTLPEDTGHLRLHPAGGSLPPTSTINYVAGQTRANNAVVTVNASGELGVYVNQPSGSVHVIIDVNGFFE